MTSFNPAEAEEGFKSSFCLTVGALVMSFNPAEAEEGFKRQADAIKQALVREFQSSRSRRRV